MHVSTNVEQNELMHIIKSLQNEMVKIGLKEGLTAKKTIAVSQTLDEYIIKYQTLLTGGCFSCSEA